MPSTTARAEFVFGGTFGSAFGSAIPETENNKMDNHAKFDFRPKFSIPKVETNYWNTVSTGRLNESVKKWIDEPFSNPLQFGLGPKFDVWQPLNTPTIDVRKINIPKPQTVNIRKDPKILFDRLCVRWVDKVIDDPQEVLEWARTYKTCLDEGIFTSTESYPSPRTYLPIQAIGECIRNGKYPMEKPTVVKMSICNEHTIKLDHRDRELLISYFCSEKLKIPKNATAELQQIIKKLHWGRCLK
jgi:hypothetical protein